MSSETVDALFDEPHFDPADTCPNCRAALADSADPDAVFLGRTWRQTVRLRHDQSIRLAAFAEKLLTSRLPADENGVVTYEITEPLQ